MLVAPSDNTPYGDKLNRMFAEANGEYVVAVGDDDWLASDYVSQVVGSLAYWQSPEGSPNSQPRDLDYLGYKILYLNNGKFQYEIVHTADITGWPTDKFRGVCQTCPVRTSIARSVPFGNDYFDDRKWSLAVGEQVKKHIFLNRTLYYYDYGESVGTAPDQKPGAWVDTDRVGTWDYKFPWWEGPTWLS